MKWQQLVVVGLLCFQAMLAAVIIAEPGALGIPPIAVAWASIINVGCGIALNQLNRIQENADDQPHAT